MKWALERSYFRDFLEYVPTKFPDLSPLNIINWNGLDGILDKAQNGLPWQNRINFWTSSTIILRDIILEHHFMDGNKRIGYLFASHILELHHYRISASEDEKVNFCLDIAQGLYDYTQITKWLKNHTEKFT
jgi:death-on-curing family protein